MGWRNYNQGNLFDFDGNLGPVEATMRQIIQEQDEKKESVTFLCNMFKIINLFVEIIIVRTLRQ